MSLKGKRVLVIRGGSDMGRAVGVRLRRGLRAENAHRWYAFLRRYGDADGLQT